MLAAGETVGNPRTGTAGRIKGGKAQRCEVYLPPHTWQQVTTGVPDLVVLTLAHGVAHCHQGFLAPDVAAYRAEPGWTIEGGADWAGVSLALVAEPTHWEEYLTVEASLFARAYSAMGWWFHLEHLGRDVWTALRTIWTGAQDSRSAYVAAGGDLDDVYDAWAASMTRIPAFGDVWDVHGIGAGNAIGGFRRSRAQLTPTRPVVAGAYDVRSRGSIRRRTAWN